MEERARVGRNTSSSAYERMERARRELLALHTESGAIRQEWIACTDGARRAVLMRLYFACQSDWNDALHHFRESVGVWRAQRQ